MKNNIGVCLKKVASAILADVDPWLPARRNRVAPGQIIVKSKHPTLRTLFPGRSAYGTPSTAGRNVCRRPPLALFVFLLAAVTVGCGRHELISKQEREAALQEIYSIKPIFRTLTPDNAGNNVAYLQAVENGRRLFIVNHETGQIRAIPTTNEVIQIFGWSPDDRYLAYSEVSPELLPAARTNGSYLNETWAGIYDTTTGLSRRLTTNSGAIEGPVTWLGTNLCLFAVSPIGKDYSQKFMLDLASNSRRQVYHAVNNFVLISSNRAAFIANGNISQCELTGDKYPKLEAISHFTPDEFDSLRWLRFDSNSGDYFFCARPEKSDLRFLFQFNPQSQELKQLTQEDTYNGQLLRGGTGFAYVGNVSNRFYLAVRSPLPGDETNLFENGCVVNYAASPKGNRLFVTAAIGLEPQGIWEYDLDAKRLRRLVAAEAAGFDARRLAEPKEFRFKSADGLEIPYFVLRPARDAAKHPVMIYLPPLDGQFQKGFELPSQLFAGLGFFYVAVNYRGCDGYGRDYATEANPALAAQDVLGILKNLAAADGSFDLKNVFLWSQSSGGEIVNALTAAQPDAWRGAVLDHPAGFNLPADIPAGSLPSLLVFSGDQDRFLPGLQKLAEDAKNDGDDVRLLVQTNTGHIVWKVSDNIRTEREVLNFIFGHLK